MVVASFRAQYGIRLATDLPTMKWREFSAYIAGLDGKTPLGRIISIRAEKDPEVLKQFTPDQRKIRSDWQVRQAKKMPKASMDDVIEGFRKMFISLAGGMTPRSEEAPDEDAKADMS